MSASQKNEKAAWAGVFLVSGGVMIQLLLQERFWGTVVGALATVLSLAAWLYYHYEKEGSWEGIIKTVLFTVAAWAVAYAAIVVYFTFTPYGDFVVSLFGAVSWGLILIGITPLCWLLCYKFFRWFWPALPRANQFDR